MINRAIPNSLAKRLLSFFYPEWADECGFLAYYDNCYYSGMKKTLERNGFEIVTEELRFYQSIYYKFFLPLYCCMVLYDGVVAALGIKNLCCQVIFVARKQSTAS
jgi:hypothetical protein